jgi:predicted homoserine dehydrogenase-like protein
MSYGLAENAETARQEKLLPIGLAEGCRLRRPLARDRVLCWDDVQLPEGRLCDQLWQEQMQRFFPHHLPNQEALHEIAGHRI